MSKEAKPEYVKKRVLILGCGNILFGDDGFGPATVQYIEKKCKIPDDVHVLCTIHTCGCTLKYTGKPENIIA